MKDKLKNNLENTLGNTRGNLFGNTLRSRLGDTLDILDTPGILYSQENLKKYFNFINGPSYGVSNILKEKGYNVAGHAGIRKKVPLSNFLGILKEREPLEKSLFGIKYIKNRRAMHLATIWFNDSKRKANESSNWLVEVYGKEYLSEVSKLIKPLSKQYCVKVKINLKTELPREETYLSDLI